MHLAYAPGLTSVAYLQHACANLVRPSLAQTFTSARPRGEKNLDPGDLEAQLLAALEQARKAYPSLAVPNEQFTAYLAQRMPAGAGVAEWLSSVQLGDLYLSCACALGDAKAMAQFDEKLLPQVAPAIAGIDSSPSFMAEVQQQIRRKLFLADGAAPPKIADYAGFGPLLHWLRVVAVRTALNYRRGEHRKDVPVEDDVLFELPGQARDLELDYLKTRYRRDFSAAFRHAISQLSSQERNVLRLRFVDGLSLSQVGAAYQADKSTVSRWIAKSRATVVELTREELTRRLRLDPKELESLMQLVHSQLDVSINSLLRRSRDS